MAQQAKNPHEEAIAILEQMKPEVLALQALLERVRQGERSPEIVELYKLHMRNLSEHLMALWFNNGPLAQIEPGEIRDVVERALIEFGDTLSELSS